MVAKVVRISGNSFCLPVMTNELVARARLPELLRYLSPVSSSCVGPALLVFTRKVDAPGR